MKARQKGETIECYLDGKRLLAAKDSTIEKAGKVGLWTKSDARSCFDSLMTDVD